MSSYGFGAASPADTWVYGARRPDEISRWIAFMKEAGIRRVCCLLEPHEWEDYGEDLLPAYRQAFGRGRVCHAPIPDGHLCTKAQLEQVILPFLEAAPKKGKGPTVVHCWGGSGRTGHVLAAHLVRHHDFDIQTALTTVVDGGRDPREAIAAENATEEALLALIRGPVARVPVRELLGDPGLDERERAVLAGLLLDGLSISDVTHLWRCHLDLNAVPATITLHDRTHTLHPETRDLWAAFLRRHQPQESVFLIGRGDIWDVVDRLLGKRALTVDQTRLRRLKGDKYSIEGGDLLVPILVC